MSLILWATKKQLDRLLSHFQEVQFEHIARSSNTMADALAVLGSRFNNDNGLIAPKIRFSRLDAPASSLLPSGIVEEIMVIEEYDVWYRPTRIKLEM